MIVFHLHALSVKKWGCKYRINKNIKYCYVKELQNILKKAENKKTKILESIETYPTKLNSNGINQYFSCNLFFCQILGLQVIKKKYKS